MIIPNTVYGKIKAMFQTTNQLWLFPLHAPPLPCFAELAERPFGPTSFADRDPRAPATGRPGRQPATNIGKFTVIDPVFICFS
jgi:hypothetical protein